MPKSLIAQAMEDLQITTDDMQTDPKAFIKRIMNKAAWLESQLKKPNSLSDIEEDFKSKAFKNTEAKVKAQQVISKIMNLIFEEDIEVVANILTMFPEVTSTANNMVKSMSIRQSNTEVYTKRELHLMYMALKKGYEHYIRFMEVFYADKLPKVPPVIRGLSGNYVERSSSGIKTYIYTLDGEEYTNAYSVARKLGIQERVSFYLDLVEICESGEFENLTMREA